MRRNFGWFNFWLLALEDPDPERAGQYEHWRRMRTALGRAAAR
jgi:hypothetical protein